MPQARIPAVFMRGGSSKGLFFHDRDLPVEPLARERLFLAAMGSPDPYARQLDGMGGGYSSVSKVVVVGDTPRAGADVAYTFAQVAVDRPLVDYGANCGNLSAAVGPFAVDEGLVCVADGEALVRLHNTNTDKIIHARFPVRHGEALTGGDFAIPAVSGAGARIRLEFLDPGGAATAALLPTGRVREPLALEGAEVEVSLVDASNPVVFVAAVALGLTGTETPEALDADRALGARLERLRRCAAVRMGMAEHADRVGLANPKIALVAPPAAYVTAAGRRVPAEAMDVTVRMISMGAAHRAMTLTGAMCTAVAARIAGTVVEAHARPAAPGADLRIANPAGVLPVAAEVSAGPPWHARKAIVYRTARRLMEGRVLAPAGR